MSLLCRAHRDTGRVVYRELATQAFRALTLDVEAGGVRLADGTDGAWLEETVVDPPTHILNGFLWAIWGVYDYAALTDSPEAESLVRACAHTLERNLRHFDSGFWSLYEQSGTRWPMLASRFYHQLHISQLSITARLLDMPELGEWAARWAGYARNRLCRRRALAQKALFKLCYY